MVVAHVCRKVDESFLVFHVHAVVLPYNPAPCATARACRTFSLVARLHNIPRYGGFCDRGEVVGYCDGAPWGSARKRYAGSACTIAVVFFGHRVGDRVHSVVAVAQARRAVISVYAGFRQQRPSLFSYSEKCGECESVAKLRGGAERSVGYIEFLVAWFCAFPSYHGIALRSEENGGFLGETEAGGLLIDYHSTGVALTGQGITERYVVVGHKPFHSDSLSVFVLECCDESVGIIINVAFLDFVLIE